MKTYRATLLFVLKDNQILLGHKKRGFGQGLINGVGGKLELGETFADAMIRETQEEIGITPTKWQKAAIHNFTVWFKGEHGNLICHTYIATDYDGEPCETDEIRPEWFDVSKMPFDKMWSDDILWLPRVLKGEKLVTYFDFDKDDKIQSYTINTVTSFDDFDD